MVQKGIQYSVPLFGVRCSSWYEFGVKASQAVTHTEGFVVVGVMSCPENPYDDQRSGLTSCVTDAHTAGCSIVIRWHC